MFHRLSLFTALVLVALILSSCGSHAPVRTPEPTIESTPEETTSAEQPDVVSDAEAADQQAVAEEFIRQVIEEAILLRTDGRRLAEEGSLEESRKAYDGSLNVILNSGLALDAHPQLSKLFKDITREVIRVEDQIAASENEEEEATLAEELDAVEEVEEIGENVQAPPAVTYDLPVVQNKRVEQFIELFSSGAKREAFAAGIARSGQFIERFREILAEEGVPSDLVYLAMIESTFKVKAFSRARAKGIWQFMSWTGKRYGLKIDWWVDERSDPYKACRAAARYLRDLYNDLGDWWLAMAAYNGGPGRVGRAVRALKTDDFWKISQTRYLRRETRNFVPSILAAAIIMKQPEKYGFDDVELHGAWEFDEVKIDDPVDLRIVADMAGVTAESIRDLNPALRRMITPQSYPGFTLRVPKGAGDGLGEKLAALPVQKRLKYAEHLVRRGDTLSGIAKRYGSSVRTIQQANNIRNPRSIKPGLHLVIPLSPGAEPTFAASEPVRTKASRGEKVTHSVRRGESLYTIARRYGTTVGSIAEWNNLNPRAPIHPGDKLDVYAYLKVEGTTGGTIVSATGQKIVYRVKQGDTLYDIANKYRTTVANLKRWNNLRRNLIRPGDQLTVYLEEGASN